MTPYYQNDAVTLYAGDCLAVLPTLPDNSVDAVVTDPPAGISFMGRDWDDHRGGREQWAAWLAQVMREVYRLAKPGAHALVWALPRTSHWTAIGIEDAGWEIRDRVTHLFGTGFPKSLDVSKAIDKRRDWALVERLSDEIRRARAAAGLSLAEIGQATMAATEDTYGKWYHRGGHMFFETGRSLPSRPEWEQLRHVLPIDPEFVKVYDEAEREVIGQADRRSGPGRHMMALAGDYGDSVIPDITAPATADAQRWSGWGTALKPAAEDWWLARKPLVGTVATNVLAHGTGALNIDGCRLSALTPEEVARSGKSTNGAIYGDLQPVDWKSEGKPHPGRWPANVTLDEIAAATLDRMSGELVTNPGTYRRDKGDAKQDRSSWTLDPGAGHVASIGDRGGASRFYFTAKAGSDERITHDGVSHPTVKPLSLMRWLTRLVCPPGGVCLDPFAGSGTTVEAAIIEGFRCIAIEREADYLPLITQRLNRRRDPIAYLTTAGEDLGLFGEPA
jgi:hypothetical protein